MGGGIPLTEVEKTGREICCSMSGNQESCFVHVKFEMLIRHTPAVAKKSSLYNSRSYRSSLSPLSEIFSYFMYRLNEFGSPIFKCTTE